MTAGMVQVACNAMAHVALHRGMLAGAGDGGACNDDCDPRVDGAQHRHLHGLRHDAGMQP